MSSQYITEPPPTATVIVHTTAGPLTISLFAQQTPLTTRNFLQHCLDGSYDGNIFHRVAPGFVIQTGDPTGTGEGGQSIYEDREFERYDRDWANVLKRDVEGEKIKFGDETHTRLKFNRRGLVGLAKGTGQDGGYGSQFFITLGDCRAELDGKCTMFGRVEGDGIYNVVKIAEGELLEGTERPMYPEKILRIEILEMPRGPAWEKMSKRTRVATRVVEDPKSKKKSAARKKGGKALLSFGGDEGEDGESVVVRPKKAKFNTALINGDDGKEREEESRENRPRPKPNGPLSGVKASSPTRRSLSPQRPQKRKVEPVPGEDESSRKRRSHSPTPKRRKPSFHDPTTQLPLRDPESPSRSPSLGPTSSERFRQHTGASATTKTSASALEAEIAALKHSMRRDAGTVADPVSKPKSALESLIPATSTRGRKRPRPGETNEKEGKSAIQMLSAFRARLEKADSATGRAAGAANGDGNRRRSSNALKAKSRLSPAPSASINTNANGNLDSSAEHHSDGDDREEEDEARLCDLHFIANCQSCFAADHADADASAEAVDHADDDDRDDDGAFLTHRLTFEKDRLGKDLTWKKKSEEELVVIDPRERERELGIKSHHRSRDREKERGKKEGKRRAV